MVPRQRDRSLGDGVYFSPEDYLGLNSRLLILVVDTVVVVAFLALLTSLWINQVGRPSAMLIAIAVAAVWVYQVPLKRSRWRTVGYRVAGAKLVTLEGRRPSLFLLTVRSLLWTFGPFNLLFDLIWSGIDDDQQTMRDRFTKMCLVKNEAHPIGTGEVHLAYFNAFGYTLIYPHVVHPRLEEA